MTMLSVQVHVTEAELPSRVLACDLGSRYFGVLRIEAQADATVAIIGDAEDFRRLAAAATKTTEAVQTAHGEHEHRRSVAA